MLIPRPFSTTIASRHTPSLCFSTPRTTKPSMCMHSRSMSTYTKNATRLIHAAKTWTSRDWAVAVDGLRHFKWQQKESTRDSTLAWSLLDRALREETLLAHRANTDTSTGMGAVEMLHGFVYSWSEAPTKISVTDMWNKLEAYKRLGTCPMISTYNIVLDVAIKCLCRTLSRNHNDKRTST
jgi:hypothetical protein